MAEGRTPLHTAALAGREEEVRELIATNNCSVDCVDSNGRTPLYLAARKGHVGVVKMLVSEFGADVAIRDKNGDSALNVAAFHGQSEVVSLLVSEFSCSLSVKSQYGRPPLHQACCSDNVELVGRMISQFGCDTMARDDDGCTPLHIAALAGREKVARELVTKYNCPVNCVDSNGRTPLHLAARKGHVGVVRMLVSEFGADVATRNKNGDSALNVAALNGQSEVVSLLVSEFKCSPSVKGFNGRTPLHKACCSGNAGLVGRMISQFGCYTMARDDDGCTPLHIAALCGREEVVRELVTKYNCPVDWVDSNGKTSLHLAARKGHVGVVRMLVSEFGADVSACDRNGDSALNVAAFHGQSEVVSLLVSEFSCSLSVKGHYGRTPLHHTCNNGNVALVGRMISQFGCDTMARDDYGCTPLHIAAWYGREEVVRELVTKYNCPVNCVGSNGRTPLHLAARRGHVGVVRMLVSEFGADVATRDKNGNSVLNEAAFNGQSEVVSLLIPEFSCSQSVKGFNGRTLLHQACDNGNAELVGRMITQFGCDAMARDDNGSTPLHIAALAGREEVVRELVSKYNCPVNCVGSNGQTPLHLAAWKGHVGVVRMLVSEFGADVATRDKNGNSALHLAALSGQSEVVSLLISEFRCNPRVKGQYGGTSLHIACNSGNAELVGRMISQFRCDTMFRDDEGCTPLHIAALCGREEVVRELVTKYNCPVNCVNSYGRTPLHLAASEGHVGVVRLLIELGCSSSTKDKQGNTALYYALKQRHHDTVEELVRHNCSLSTVDELYKKIDALSSRKLAKGSLTKIFIVGNAEVGKSTLMEALQNETFFNRDVKDVPPHTCGIIPVAHESNKFGKVIFYDFAGDQEYYSSHATLLEKLMGGSESNIFLLLCNLSKLPENEKETACSIHYWLRFISYCTRVSEVKPQVVLVGSHADVVKGQGKNPEGLLNVLFTGISSSLYSGQTTCPIEMAGYVAINCCKTKTKEIQKLRTQLNQIRLSSPPPTELSEGAKILLGLLERDFKDESACQFSTIVRHIKKHKIYLPTETEQLQLYFRELDAYGLVLLLDSSSTPVEAWIILNIEQFLCNVHKKLFSPSFRRDYRDSLSNLGIIPESRLWAIFPEFQKSFHLLKDCLKLLQYCQEISDPQIISKVLETSTPLQVQSTAHSNSFLFFPSLVEAERGGVLWVRSLSSPYYTGWFAECSKSRPYDFFPPRFLHVLLLRLAFTFALPKPSTDAASGSSEVDVYSRKCSLWKNGIHWLGENGVEAVVEVVKHSRAVVVMVRGSSEEEMECVDTLSSIVNRVAEAKAEFCHTLLASTFLINPNDTKGLVVPEADQLHLFEMSEVQKVLCGREGAAGVVSQDGRGFLPTLQLCHIHSQTVWGCDKNHLITIANTEIIINPVVFSGPGSSSSLLVLPGGGGLLFALQTVPQLLRGIFHLAFLCITGLLFPMGLLDLIHSLARILVSSWYSLGLELGVPERKLDEIEYNNPRDVARCKRLMIQEWHKRPQLKPSWCSLVDALLKIKENTVAMEISKHCNVDLQRKLLDPVLQDREIDDEYLQQLAGVIGSRWASIAPLLSLSSEIEHVTRKDSPALTMLQKLREKGPLTYGRLYSLLKANPLLNPTL